MSKRLFIAIDIPANVRAAAAEVIRYSQERSPVVESGRPPDLKPVKAISWVKPENFHITIKFLGNTDMATEVKLIETLERITSTYAPFKLHLAKPEVLGKRVMSISVRSDTATVFSLEMVIDTECERLGFKREGRRFHPHLTLARIQDPKAAAPIVQEFRKVEIMPVEFEVRELVLYESKLTSKGSIYSRLLSPRFGVPPFGGQD